MSSAMQQRLFSTLLIFTLGIGVAGAQQPPSGDKGTIVKCLESETAGFGGQCIGIVADPCIKKAEGSQTDVKDKSACAARELAIWNSLLADALKQVKAGGFADVIKGVASSQTAWSQSMKALCPVFNKLEPGMLDGGAEYCSLQDTARRALILRRVGEAVNEH